MRFLQQQKEEQRILKERRELAHQRDHAYDDLHTEEAVAASSNQDNDGFDYDEDFM